MTVSWVCIQVRVLDLNRMLWQRTQGTIYSRLAERNSFRGRQLYRLVMLFSLLASNGPITEVRTNCDSFKVPAAHAWFASDRAI